MNPVESLLRTKSARMRVESYKRTLIEAADEIKRLEEVQAELVAACKEALLAVEVPNSPLWFKLSIAIDVAERRI